MVEKILQMKLKIEQFLHQNPVNSFVNFKQVIVEPRCVNIEGNSYQTSIWVIFRLFRITLYQQFQQRQGADICYQIYLDFILFTTAKRIFVVLRHQLQVEIKRLDGHYLYAIYVHFQWLYNWLKKHLFILSML